MRDFVRVHASARVCMWVRACVTCAAGQMPRAMEILDDMAEMGMRDAFAYNIIMRDFAKRKQWRQGSAFLERMEMEDVEPDLMSYRFLSRARARALALASVCLFVLPDVLQSTIEVSVCASCLLTDAYLISLCVRACVFAVLPSRLACVRRAWPRLSGTSLVCKTRVSSPICRFVSMYLCVYVKGV